MPADTHLIGPRPAATPALIKMVCEQFGLAAVRTTRDVGGTYNLNLRLHTIDHRAYIVRVYRPWVTAARLQTLVEVKRRLNTAGMPTPTPLQSRDGAASIQHDGRWVEVEPYVAHDGNCDTVARYQIGFELLARFHDCLEGMPVAAFVPPRVANYVETATLVDWIRQIEPTLTDQDALSLCQQARDLLAVIQDWWQAAGESLPQRYTHGDFGGENLLFQHDDVVAVLDLDFVARCERIFDLAYTLYWMLVRLGDDQIVHRAASMMGAYHHGAATSLTQAELAALPVELARVPLYWIGAAIFVEHPTGEILRNRDGVRFAQRILHQRQEISEEIERLFL